MYCVYILYSTKCDRYYIGYCENIQTRLVRLNEGTVAAIKNCKPYVLKMSKIFNTQLEARREELRIKRMKSRKYIEWISEESCEGKEDRYRGAPHHQKKINSVPGHKSSDKGRFFYVLCLHFILDKMR